MKEIKKRAVELSDQIISWRRDLHQIPELDLDLPKTRGYILARLNEMGIPYRTFQGNSSIVATIIGGKPGKAVALRADMDALHITETTGLPYASTNGNMHACGHDNHAAMLLGAAKILQERKAEIPGTVKLFFQCAEEGSGGAEDLIRDGVMENPDVGAVFGQHVGQLLADLPPGYIGFYPGGFMASRDSFIITVKGKGGHGATPAECIDPVVISAHLVLALQELVSRECAGTDMAVLTIGSIHGGEVYNVIPDTVELGGAIRCLDEAVRQKLDRRIPEVCEGICQTYRASCEIEFEKGYPVTYNDDGLTQFTYEIARDLFGEDEVGYVKKPMMSSEDFAFYAQKCPGSFWFLSTRPTDRPAYPNHSSNFVADDQWIYRGTAILAASALKWLQEAVDK